ncbi:MAG: hypothetical protein B6I23_01760 [Rickettsiaceae bacterium 4572_127]|nr:MAG: hypothetical protein B6I23_01760 [Rickettsiaceae bacterium 4572_127]
MHNACKKQSPRVTKELYCKFRKQVPLLNYIVDFICFEKK